jgi:hypothetical protein
MSEQERNEREDIGRRVAHLAELVERNRADILGNRNRITQLTILQVGAHTVILVCLIAAGVTLSALGKESAPSWAAFGAYVAGAAVQRGTNGNGS